MRAHILVNTTANLYRTKPGALDAIRRVAEGRARVFATSTLPELADACRAIASEGSDCVVLSGGDGTFMAGVTELARAFGDSEDSPAKLPVLALLPGGTVATVARN